MLGPKPKKPIEEKSFSSALISGTKRKLQSLFGSSKAGSDSRTNSPKKRKVDMEPSLSTKAKNAVAQSKAALARAEREASEHSRQIESRGNRAMKRSTGLVPRRARSAAGGTKATAVKVTKHTTVTFKRKALKPLAKGGAKKTSNVRIAVKGKTLAGGGRKGVQALKRPSTPVRESSADESASEGESPNITPASLRGASGRSTHFSPTSHELIVSPSASKAGTKLAAKLQKRGSSAAPRGLHKTGAGVKKSQKPVLVQARKSC